MAGKKKDRPKLNEDQRKLIEDNVGLAFHLAMARSRMMGRTGYDNDDLSAAFDALVDATYSWNPAINPRFAAYAKASIRNRMQFESRCSRTVIRVPHHAFGRKGHVRDFQFADDARKALGVSSIHGCEWSDYRDGDDLIEDHRATLSEIAEDKEAMDARIDNVYTAMATLNPGQRRAVIRRADGMSFAQMDAESGVSSGASRLKFKRAVENLRKVLSDQEDQ